MPDSNHQQSQQEQEQKQPQEKQQEDDYKIRKKVAINKARDAIRGKELSIKELETLQNDLESFDQFAYATEILLILLDKKKEANHTTSLKDHQTLAKYIYKDHSLPSSFKFDKAFTELQTHDNLLVTGKCESLGLAGAIYKRKWQFDHQFRNLLLSQHYYKRGYELWDSFITRKSINNDNNDKGYTAINYAFITELMAVDKLEEFSKSTGVTDGIVNNLAKAAEVRDTILKYFITYATASKPAFNEANEKLATDAWVVATIIEAYFGLKKYPEALYFIKQYVSLQSANPWEIRSFGQQISSLAYLQLFVKKLYNQQANEQTKEDKAEGKPTGYELLQSYADSTDEGAINNCLAMLVAGAGAPNAELKIKKDGKVGLALSGGGFRASLFHIGVLASMAENDELRNIDVISCVSGGSIIGAYYYLKLKKLLEENIDNNISKQHYIDIVKETEKDFLAGVQKNLRMRIFSNLGCNIRMLTESKKYSRSHRIGELYEEYLYKPLTGKGNLYMQDLFIDPLLEPGERFSYSTDNWKRKNKVPQLVLNATSVNTGHNWQFTASWMGEPPGNIQTDIDVKPRLRRMYYEDAPEAYKSFRLGYAVGASACVPVMFHPMPMADLYPDIDLQLVDGGLHDNQGIAALIEQECKEMIISDASGQLPTDEGATHNEALVFYRTDNILQERLRELQFLDITEREYTTQLRSLIKLHLKKDLRTEPVSWINCIDRPRRLLYDETYTEKGDLLKFGILHSVQLQLSEIRTDLDSFHDTEAFALMYSGYMQM
ncbi:MAG: patatin-like phospholipase family protein, partial [Bacteroidota bacterium]